MASAAVDIAVMPADTVVAPGDTLDLTLQVTAPGSAFNGFEIAVAYDSPGLALLPLDPIALQQGCLMTGGCSAACGTTFHRFEAAADSLVITDILLCDQVALTGPGPIYHLRFLASDTPQVAHVMIRNATFYDGGVIVGPGGAAGAVVRIEALVAVGDGPLASRGTTLRVLPNPARAPIALLMETPGASLQQLEAFDLSGRRVRRIDAGWHPAGQRRVTWDGRDEAGRPLFPGVYVIALRAGDATAYARVALIR
jgi:hypothetical protein